MMRQLIGIGGFLGASIISGTLQILIYGRQLSVGETMIVAIPVIVACALDDVINPRRP